ncbi:MAG TPA: hypothetical protein VFX49_04165 [Chloroflexota bacterium]|nr:hypothetical protein [Chloroflexota bacterium]
MELEAFVLPLPDRSLGVVIWDRVRRRGTASSLAVYAPGELSPGELSEVASALTRSVGEALGQGLTGRPGVATLAIWWIVAALAAVLLAARGLTLGPGYAWLALLAVGVTLPWGMGLRALRADSLARAARRIAVRAGEVAPIPGGDARTRERLLAVWQFARGQRGTFEEQLVGLERFCRDNMWPAIADVYADRRAAAGGEADRVQPRPHLGRRAPRRRLYAALEMRAWRLS